MSIDMSINKIFKKYKNRNCGRMVDEILNEYNKSKCLKYLADKRKRKRE